MRTVPSYWANIYVAEPRWAKAEPICREYVDTVGLCVTITKTEYAYTGGKEDGVIVGLINYPRFPATPATVRKRALALAGILRKRLGQTRVSVVFPDETVMLGRALEEAPQLTTADINPKTGTLTAKAKKRMK